MVHLCPCHFCWLLPTDPLVVLTSGEDCPLVMDTDPHLQTTPAASVLDQHSCPEGKLLLWHLSAYCEQEDSAKFYVSCLSEHIPHVLHEEEGEGQPSLAEVEGLERAWQAEQACIGSVEEGGAELSGRGPEKRDAGVQTDEGGGRSSVEVWRRACCVIVHYTHS